MPETKTCRITGITFEVTDQEVELCQVLGVPLPSICPEERWRALLATRNEWKLYPRRCDATGDQILSAYHATSPFTVYKNAVWWGDTWDATSYGRDFDFTKPFFEQFDALRRVVPREGTSVFNSENCDYNSHIRDSKNCYMNSLNARCEDTMYSYWIVDGTDIVDCAFAYPNCMQCYGCTDITRCYNCVMVDESIDSHDSFFSYQLRGCNNCIFSSNLANKSYYAFNKPCTKEEFETIKEHALNGSWESFVKAKERYREIRKKSIHRATHTINCEDTRGDHLYNSRRCFESYEGNDNEDCAHSISMGGSNDISSSYSAGWPKCEQVYFSCVSRGASNIAFCTYTWFSQNLRYCDSVRSSKDCFGSIGLQHKSYCILNKQYTKEEYEALVPRIVDHMKQTGEWGEFFPGSISPFPYNDTGAQDYYPLTLEEASAGGFRWEEMDVRVSQPQTIPTPDSLVDIPDSFVNTMLQCATCQKNFKIIPQELKFYRTHSLPIPRSCGACRHQERMSYRNPYQLWERPCMQCGTGMHTTYAPERPETVYCDACYLQAVD